jgi:hypothetical protein
MRSSRLCAEEEHGSEYSIMFFVCNVWVVKCTEMRRAGNLRHFREVRNIYKILSEKPQNMATISDTRSHVTE